MPDAKLIQRQDVVYFIDTSENDTPVWALINKGITAMDGSSNAETEDKQYIADKTKTTTTKSLTPSYAITGEAYNGDPANDFLYEIGRAQTINKKVKICRVELFKEDAETAGTFAAQLGTYSLTYDSFDSGAGGDPLGFGCTTRQEGALVEGSFAIDASGTSGDFTEEA